MTELKFVEGLKFEGMPKFEVMLAFEVMPKFEDGPGFTGGPRFVGLDLAKRTMEVCVLRAGQKPQRFSGIGTGEAGREKQTGERRKQNGKSPRISRFAVSPWSR
jgi:hypothetical protein